MPDNCLCKLPQVCLPPLIFRSHLHAPPTLRPAILFFATTSYIDGSQPREILPPGDSWQSLETFLVVTPGEGKATGIRWVEARDAAQHLTVHRTPLTTQNEPAQAVSSAEAKKPRPAALTTSRQQTSPLVQHQGERKEEGTQTVDDFSFVVLPYRNILGKIRDQRILSFSLISITILEKCFLQEKQCRLPNPEFGVRGWK